MPRAKTAKRPVKKKAPKRVLKKAKSKTKDLKKSSRKAINTARKKKAKKAVKKVAKKVAKKASPAKLSALRQLGKNIEKGIQTKRDATAFDMGRFIEPTKRRRVMSDINSNLTFLNDTSKGIQNRKFLTTTEFNNAKEEVRQIGRAMMETESIQKAKGITDADELRFTRSGVSQTGRPLGTLTTFNPDTTVGGAKTQSFNNFRKAIMRVVDRGGRFPKRVFKGLKKGEEITRKFVVSTLKNSSTLKVLGNIGKQLRAGVPPLEFSPDAEQRIKSQGRIGID